MTRCDQIRDWLAAAADEALSASDQSAVDSHLEGCADCRKVAAWMIQVDPLVAGLPLAAAPSAAEFGVLRDRVMQQVLTPSPKPTAVRRWWLRWPTLAPAAVVVVLIGVVTVRQFQETAPLPPDAGFGLGRIEAPAVSPAPPEALADLEAETVPPPPAGKDEVPQRNLRQDRALLAPRSVAKSAAPEPSAVPAEEADLDDAPGLGELTMAAVSAPASDSVLPRPSLRGAWDRARDAVDAPDEATHLANLVTALESDPAPVSLRKLSERVEANSEVRSLAGAARESRLHAPLATSLGDSVVTHLRERIAVISDPDLRQRALRQLRIRGRE